jgi:hypothetical protein
MIFPPPLGWPHCLIFFALYHSSFGVIGQQSLSRVGFLMSPLKLFLSVRLSSSLTKKPTREK